MQNVVIWQDFYWKEGIIIDSLDSFLNTMSEIAKKIDALNLNLEHSNFLSKDDGYVDIADDDEYRASQESSKRDVLNEISAINLEIANFIFPILVNTRWLLEEELINLKEQLAKLEKQIKFFID